MHVYSSPHEKHDNGQSHTQSGDPKPHLPANGVLNINDDGLSKQEDEGESGVVPIEEAVDASSSVLGGGVELVNAKRDAAWADARGAYGEEEEARKKGTQVGFASFLTMIQG